MHSANQRADATASAVLAFWPTRLPGRLGWHWPTEPTLILPKRQANCRASEGHACGDEPAALHTRSGWPPWAAGACRLVREPVRERVPTQRPSTLRVR